MLMLLTVVGVPLARIVGQGIWRGASLAHAGNFQLDAASTVNKAFQDQIMRLPIGSVKNLGRYAASWIAWWPRRPSSTAALT